MGIELVTVEIDSELMERLRAAGIDPQVYIQSVMDRKGAEHRSERERNAAEQEWADANRSALAAYNEQVDKIGTFASRQRERCA